MKKPCARCGKSFEEEELAMRMSGKGYYAVMKPYCMGCIEKKKGVQQLRAVRTTYRKTAYARAGYHH